MCKLCLKGEISTSTWNRKLNWLFKETAQLNLRLKKFGYCPLCLLAREGPSSALFENSRNLASSSSGLGPRTTGNLMEHGRGVRREPQSSSILTPHFFDQGITTLNTLSHTGGTYSHNGMMDYPIFPIWEIHLRKFPHSLGFLNWKVNFKTEVCAKSAFSSHHYALDQRS